MLFEWLHSAVTPCPRAFRDMGFLQEVVAIDARWRRCRAAWTDHLERSRLAVTRAIERTERRGTAMLLGSGLLLDAPVAELAASFERVILVDAVHSPVARWRARRWRNVEFLAADVSGIVEPLHATRRGEPLPSPLGLERLHERDLDLVVSLNILSQLGVLPYDWAERTHGSDAAATLARAITQRHLDDLAVCPAAVCLIADIEMWSERRDGTVVNRGSTIFDTAPPRSYEDWVWALAPAPEHDPELSDYRRVIASYRPA